MIPAMLPDSGTLRPARLRSGPEHGKPGSPLHPCRSAGPRPPGRQPRHAPAALRHQASKAAPINHSGSGNDSTLASQFADHNGGSVRVYQELH